MRSRFGVVLIARAALVVSTVFALGGCFLLSPRRPDPEGPVSGPVPYVERCFACHGARVEDEYAKSLHTAMGIRCGQCHTPGGHPNFTQPVRDGKCGGCHQPAFQQTLKSKHFATRLQRVLDEDRAARAALRREGFVGATADRPHFVGDTTSGELGGRLCVACHYDEHRLGLGAVRRAEFCVGCHTDRETHFPVSTPDVQKNRCTECHVRADETDSGQTVNTHRFARPGEE
jgi:hypothetical protein